MMSMRKIWIGLMLFALAVSFFGCGEDSYTPDAATVGVPTAFDNSFNYFYTANESNLAAIYLCCGSLMEPTGKGEWQPYLGNITGEIKDGTLIATLKIGKKVVSPDGKKLNIDDVLFLFQMLADPGYTGAHDSFRNAPIKGVAAYYWDDPKGVGNAPDFLAQAKKRYAPEVVSETDLKTYLKETDLNGEWNGNLEEYRGEGLTWRQWLEQEGYGEELEKISSNGAKTLELLVEIYYKQEKDRFDATEWYAARLRADYMKGTLADGVDVPSISGIKRIDDYTCTVEFTDPNADYQSILYLPLLSKNNYSDYYKGTADKVAASAHKKVVYGGGPYQFVRYEDKILTLEKNKKFALGSPALATVRMRAVPEDELAVDCMLRQITVGCFFDEPSETAKAQIQKYDIANVTWEGGAFLYMPDPVWQKAGEGKSVQYYLNRLRLLPYSS